MAITTTKQRVENLNLKTDNVITSVSYDFSSDLLEFLGTVSFLRPASGDNEIMPMNLNIDIYNEPSCRTALNTIPISNKNPTDQKYFSRFFTDGNTNNFWISADKDEAVAGGFGEESAKRPIVFAIGKWLKERCDIKNFSAGTKYYIVYWWTNASIDDDPPYDNDNNSKAKSDVNSIIWPNFENY